MLAPESRPSTTRRVLTGMVVGAMLLGVVAGCGSSGAPEAATTSRNAAPRKRDTVLVPDVRHLPATAARRQLRTVGLSVAVTRRYARAADGTVVGIDPRPGAQVRRGTRVALVVSRGDKPEVANASTPASAPAAQAASPPRSGCPAGQYASPSGGCEPIPKSYGGSPPANSPEGRHAMQQSPDCQGVPPPPPGYSGPVQC